MIAFERTFLREDARRIASGPEASIFLGCFGKHPGWDDHIEDLGLETESLVMARQIMYHLGIGEQIDNGAWDQLEPADRLDEFDHLFLWQRAEQLLVGRLWSSRDGKGRSRYPMVLCAHCFGASWSWATHCVVPALAALQQSCQAVGTAAEVRSALNSTAQRLRGSLAQESQANKTDPFAVDDERTAVATSLSSHASSVGLIRVLYQIQDQLSAFAPNRSGTRGRPTESKPQHLRVPADPQAGISSLTFWGQLILTQVDPETPLLLIMPSTGRWIDIALGQPTAHEFFCLKAMPGALPLASDVPYNFSEVFRQEATHALEAFIKRQPVPNLLRGQEKGTATSAPGGGPAEGRHAGLWGRFKTIALVLLVVLIGALGLHAWRTSLKTPSQTSRVGSLQVRVEPSDAVVQVSAGGRVVYEGQSSGMIGGLSPASYEVNVSRAGYQPLVTNVVLKGSSSVMLVLRLSQAMGGLVVTSDFDTPEAMPQIWLEGSDGERLTHAVRIGGQTNLIAVGRYQLVLRRGESNDNRRPLIIEPNQLARVHLPSEGAGADLLVKTQPADALFRLLLRNELKAEGADGTTVRGLLPGEYQVEVRRKGYGLFITNVVITPDSAMEVVAVSLTPVRGSLVLEDDLRVSQRSAAEFWLETMDGTQLPDTMSGGGATNQVLSGQYQVVMRLPGIATLRHDMVVESGKVARSSFMVAERLPSLRVDTEPADALLTLMQGPYLIERCRAGEEIQRLMPGRYSLTVDRTNYVSVTTNLMVSAAPKSPPVNVVLTRSQGGLVITDNLPQDARQFAEFWLEDEGGKRIEGELRAGNVTNRLATGLFVVAMELGGNNVIRRSAVIKSNEVTRVVMSLSNAE